MKTAELNNKQSRIFSFITADYEAKLLWMNTLTHPECDCHIFVVTMVTILKQKQYTWKHRKLFSVEILLFQEKIFIEIKTT